MLAVVCKQKLFHENKIIQYLQKYKYCNVDQSDFRKPLQNFANTIKIFTFWTYQFIFKQYSSMYKNIQPFVVQHDNFTPALYIYIFWESSYIMSSAKLSEYLPNRIKALETWLAWLFAISTCGPQNNSKFSDFSAFVFFI